MPEPDHATMLHEKHRQRLLDRGEPIKQETRDIILCDIHRWLEQIANGALQPEGGDR